MPPLYLIPKALNYSARHITCSPFPPEPPSWFWWSERSLIMGWTHQFISFFSVPSALFWKLELQLDQSEAAVVVRHDYDEHDGTSITHGVNSSITSVIALGPNLALLKTKPFRGINRAEWVSSIYADLRYAFSLFGKLVIKFNMITFKHLALDLLRNNTNSTYAVNVMDPRSQFPQHLKVDLCWIQSFTEHYRIVCRSKHGKKLFSPAK